MEYLPGQCCFLQPLRNIQVVVPIAANAFVQGVIIKVDSLKPSGFGLKSTYCTFLFGVMSIHRLIQLNDWIEVIPVSVLIVIPRAWIENVGYEPRA
jgi:hypothetical protein